MPPRIRQDGTSYLYTFPFWIRSSPNETLNVRTIQINDCLIRIYPPFWTGEAVHSDIPKVAKNRIPFLRRADESAVEKLTILDTYGFPDETAIHVSFDQEKTDIPDEIRNALRLDFHGHDCEFIELTLIHHFLDIIRWNTFQWWIGHPTSPIQGYRRTSFEIDKNGSPVGESSGHASARTLTGFEANLTSAHWNESINLLSRGFDPPYYDQVWLDALYRNAIQDTRRAILDAAISCEIARDATLERLWPEDGGKLKKGRILTGNNLPTHLSTDLQKYTNGRSLETEDPELFEQIENLWSARGNIAHGGPLNYFRDGEEISVDNDLASSLIEAARNCIDWLDSL